MNPRYLLDSNILVYALDIREHRKREQAKETIRRIALGGSAALPAQALSELSNVCLRKLEPAMDPEEVRREIERLHTAFPTISLTASVVMEALRGVADYQFSYYDAQIWAVARLAQVPVVLSEDFNTGSTVEGVLFLNPLDPAFDLAALDGR